MAVYGINYDEAGSKQPLNYKSVDIRYGNGQEKVFDSGNFVKDWYDLIKYNRCCKCSKKQSLDPILFYLINPPGC